MNFGEGGVQSELQSLNQFLVKTRISGGFVLDVDGTLNDPSITKEDDPEWLELVPDALAFPADVLKRGGGVIISTTRRLSKIGDVIEGVLGEIAKLPTGGVYDSFDDACSRLLIGAQRGAEEVSLKGVTDSARGFQWEYDVLERFPVAHPKRVYDLLVGVRHTCPTGHDISRVDEMLNFKAGQEPVKITYKNRGNAESSQVQDATATAFDRVKDAVAADDVLCNAPIRVERTRSAVVIVSADAGKDKSVLRLLSHMRTKGIAGRWVGFGDKEDEFASIVPTINVSASKDSFKGVPVLWDPIPNTQPGGATAAHYMRRLVDGGFFDY